MASPWSFGLCPFGIATIFLESNILQVRKISGLLKHFMSSEIISNCKLLLIYWHGNWFLFIFASHVLQAYKLSSKETTLSTKMQKQPPRGVPRKSVLKICSKFVREHPYRGVISIKLFCNFIEITLRHGCSPVNLLHNFRTAFLKNNYGWLLLYFIHGRCKMDLRWLLLGKHQEKAHSFFLYIYFFEFVFTIFGTFDVVEHNDLRNIHHTLHFLILKYENWLWRFLIWFSILLSIVLKISRLPL